MVALFPLSTQPVWKSGQSVVSAELSFYDAGTNTPRTVYQDSATTIPWAQPILSDANGCIPIVWTSGNPLKAVINLPGGTAFRVIDGVIGDYPTSGGGSGGGGSPSFATGDLKPSYSTATQSGWVRLNGRTIGNASSGASEFADASTSALFVYLWNADTGLAVSGGRGVSGSADFAANKTIALPDARGKALFGLDDMGNSAAGILAGITFTKGNATTLGSIGGSATKALIAANNGLHSHTGTTSTAGAHQHSGTSYGAGTHNHLGFTDSQGLHTHPGSGTSNNGDHSHSFNTAGNKNSLVGAGGGTGYWSSSTSDSTSTAGNHNHSVNLSTDGAHVHNVTTYGVGDHVHAFLTDSGGAHVHTFFTDASGTGTPFDGMSPFLLVPIFIKL